MGTQRLTCSRISCLPSQEDAFRFRPARDLAASDYWLLAILDVFIIVGPFIYMYEYLDAVNMLYADYNQHG